MRCLYPQRKWKVECGTRFWYDHACGQCISCRVRRRQEWALRILLESRSHADCSFVTLTYSREHVPPFASVKKRDVQLFLKRFRKNFGSKVRYFAVGEYGDETKRPHYHLILFGYSWTDEWRGQHVEKAWQQGFVQVDELTPQRALYVAKYTTKKMTRPEDVGDGQEPEFAIMSRRPGLAKQYARLISRELEKSNLEFTNSAGELVPDKVPSHVRIAGKIYPLDVYMKRLVQEGLDGEQMSEMSKSIMANVKSFKTFVSTPPPVAEEKERASYTMARRSLKRRGKL